MPRIAIKKVIEELDRDKYGKTITEREAIIGIMKEKDKSKTF